MLSKRYRYNNWSASIMHLCPSSIETRDWTPDNVLWVLPAVFRKQWYEKRKEDIISG